MSGAAVQVAVIVVNYNSGGLLERCLAALERQTRPPERVVVVDNASTDDSWRAAASDRPGVELLRLPRNLGFAAGNNRGLERCGDCDWIALLNPDAFPEPGWLEALADAAAALPEAGSFASCLVSDADPARLDGIGDAYHVSGLVWRIGHGTPRPAAQDRREVFTACAAAAMYRGGSIRAAGGFDEDYFCYNEDVDLGFRLRLAGQRCWYVPDAVVRHVGSAVTGSHSEFSLYHGHRNLVWTWVRNMPAPLVYRYLWEHLLLNLVSLVALSVRYRTTALLRAKWAAARGLPRALRQRRAIQATRVCETGELLAVMTRGWWRCYFQRRFVDHP